MLENHTYLFYDLETTGINNSFDQIVQFAAVRTNSDFEEIERHSFFVKLNSDTLPTPMASITHLTTIAESEEKGISEYEAVQRIHQLINVSDTISIGYNTLGFDDEFLRFSFFKNLLPPYSHQFKNECFRADIYPIVMIYHLFCNANLKWPTVNDKVSLKLDNINIENKLYTQGRAHDAITDVLVTVELAKVLKKASQQVWDYLISKFQKWHDEDVLRMLKDSVQVQKNSYKEALITAGIIGAKNNFIAEVILLGEHYHYKNQAIFMRLDGVDLAEHKQKYGSLNVAHYRLTIAKKWGDVPFVLPVLDRYVSKITPKNRELYAKNKEFIQNNPQEFFEFVEFVLDYKYLPIKNIDNDASIYQSKFMTRADENACDKFHKSNLEEKVDMLEIMPKDYQQRAIRVLARLDENILPKNYQKQFDTHLQKLWCDDDISQFVDNTGKSRITPRGVLAEIDSLRKSRDLDALQTKVLDEIESYVEGKIGITINK